MFWDAFQDVFWDVFWDAWTSMVGAMPAMPPSPFPSSATPASASALAPAPAPAPAPSGSPRLPASVHCFALAVTPESLQQRWRAVLRPEVAALGTSAGASDPAALEFSTPLDLLRHLAQLPPLPSDPNATQLPRTGPAGLR